MTVLTLSFAVGLGAMTVAVLPVRAVGATAAIAVALVAVGGWTRWRWPVTVAAGTFLVGYTAALWVSGGPARPLGAAAFGCALVGLLQSHHLTPRQGRARIAARALGGMLASWLAVSAIGLAATAAATVVAASLVSALPAAVAPVLAAAGALAVVVLLAVLIARGHAQRPSPAPAAGTGPPASGP